MRDGAPGQLRPRGGKQALGEPTLARFCTKWKHYSSKVSWKSGAKEYRKVTPHNKPPARFIGREKKKNLPLLR